MTDETLERIWLLLGEGEAGTHVWCDDPNPSGNSFNHEAVGYVRTDVVERLTAERDAALAEIEIWKSVFPDIAPDRVLPDRAQAEAEAFRAGAEAMRKACASAVKNEELEGPYDNGEDMAYDVAIGHAVEVIRALPVPDHQSSTQTGTKPTNGHS